MRNNNYSIRNSIFYSIRTRIFDAIEGNNFEELKLIFDTNEFDIADHQSVLIRATELEIEPVIRFLLEKGANANATDEEGVTPLSVAAIQGNTSIVKLLLDQGADINFQEQDMLYTPVCLAAMNYHLETFKLLLSKGANPNIANQEGVTPLMKIAELGDELMVSEIIIQTALNQRNEGEDWEVMLQQIEENPRIQRSFNREAVTVITSTINNEELSNSIIDNFNIRHAENLIDKTQIAKMDVNQYGKQIMDDRSWYSRHLSENLVSQNDAQNLANHRVCELLCNSQKRDEFAKRNNLIDNLIEDLIGTKDASQDREITNLFEIIDRFARGIENKQDKEISNTLSGITPQERYKLSTSIYEKKYSENDVISLKDQSLIALLKDDYPFLEYEETPPSTPIPPPVLESPSSETSPKHSSNLKSNKRSFDEMSRG